MIRIDGSVQQSAVMMVARKAKATGVRDVAVTVVGVKVGGVTAIAMAVEAMPIEPIVTAIAWKAADGQTPLGRRAVKPTSVMTWGIAWPMGLLTERLAREFPAGAGSTPGLRGALAKARNAQTVAARVVGIAAVSARPKGLPDRLASAAAASSGAADAAGVAVVAAEVVAHEKAGPLPTVPVNQEVAVESIPRRHRVPKVLAVSTVVVSTAAARSPTVTTNTTPRTRARMTRGSRAAAIASRASRLSREVRRSRRRVRARMSLASHGNRAVARTNLASNVRNNTMLLGSHMEPVSRGLEKHR